MSIDHLVRSLSFGSPVRLGHHWYSHSTVLAELQERCLADKGRAERVNEGSERKNSLAEDKVYFHRESKPFYTSLIWSLDNYNQVLYSCTQGNDCYEEREKKCTNFK